MCLNFVADKDCINQYHFEISIRKKPNRMATLDLDGKTERQSSSLPTRKTKVFITRAIHHTIFFFLFSITCFAVWNVCLAEQSIPIKNSFDKALDYASSSS